MDAVRERSLSHLSDRLEMYPRLVESLGASVAGVIAGGFHKAARNLYARKYRRDQQLKTRLQHIALNPHLAKTPKLLSAEEANQQSPETFHIPTLQQRLTIPPGTLVKLMFAVPPQEGYPNAERMWVLVATATMMGKVTRYVGMIQNDPGFIEGLAYGDVIKFTSAHIVDWMEGVSVSGA